LDEKKIILITGTPGVGKSVISKALSERLNAHYIDLTEFVKDNDLTLSYDEDRRTFIVDEEKVSECLEKFIKDLKESYIVIDGHYSVFVISPEQVYKVFVLRRHPVELKNILLERGYDEKKVSENLASEILDVCLIDAINRCGVNKVCEININGKDVNSIVEEILEYLHGVKKCEIGIVDWLSELEKENKLDEYLNF